MSQSVYPGSRGPFRPDLRCASGPPWFGARGIAPSSRACDGPRAGGSGGCASGHGSANHRRSCRGRLDRPETCWSCCRSHLEPSAPRRSSARTARRHARGSHRKAPVDHRRVERSSCWGVDVWLRSARRRGSPFRHRHRCRGTPRALGRLGGTDRRPGWSRLGEHRQQGPGARLLASSIPRAGRGFESLGPSAACRGRRAR